MSNYYFKKDEEAATSGNSSDASRWTFPKPEPSYEEYRRQIRKDLHDALSQESVSIDWNTVQALLMKLLQHQATYQQQVPTFPQTPEQLYASAEEDPLGRIFLTRLVSRDPPVACLDLGLQAFPHGICSSHPVAFFFRLQQRFHGSVGSHVSTHD